ncbi:MAG: hypothetical protein NTU98_10245 [Bacteroidetes bacterium]|nr:hypothetical protein [Bacteroidota bacterium]
MKTKNLFTFAFIMIAVMALILAGCSKDKTTEKGTTNTESMQQLTNDNNNVMNAVDQVVNDANSVLNSASSLKSGQMGGGPCNTTVTVGGIINDSITVDIEYHGKDCPEQHLRTGHILIKKKYNEPWGDPGTTVLITTNNFSITKLSNGKTIILNGIKHYQNVSGHYLWELDSTMNVTSITHKIWGSVSATFTDDNTTRVWNIARQHIFTGQLSNYTLVMTTDGFGSADGYDNLETWGLTRAGENFYTQITQSVVHKMACNWAPCAGIIIHQIPSDSKSLTITFGYDINNNLITNGDCPARYRVDWVVNGNSGTFFLPL